MKMSLSTLLAILFVNLLMKSVSPMGLRNLRQIDDWPTREIDVLPSASKRHVSGADPWSLCPHTMERVDCFYEYLRVYARLRQEVSQSNRVSVRNIGKRLAYSTITNNQDVI